MIIYVIINELNDKFKKALNACIRFIFNMSKDVHISEYRHRTGLLSVAKRSQLFLWETLFSCSYRIRSLIIYLNILFLRKATLMIHVNCEREMIT